MKKQTFMQDMAEIAADRYVSGGLDRRSFLQICAAAGVAPGLLLSSRASAADEVVVVNWGGDAVRYYGEAWGEPFEADTGIPVAIDGAGPTDGRIRAMVESGNVTWDCCDGDLFTPLSLGPRGLLEPIDYSIVDRNAVRPGHAFEHGIAGYLYSYVLAYDAEKFGDDPPQSWADFWNVEKYPGGRSFYKWMNGALEAALLADGVPMDEVYPIDMDRAFHKLEEIKPHVSVYWESGAASQQMFRDGEVSMGAIWHTRARLLELETDGRFTWTWNQGNAGGGCWVVPKGNPAGKAAMEFIASAQIPERQLHLLNTQGNGLANPHGTHLVPDDLKRVDPGTPENWAVQLPMGVEWFAENYDDALNAWLDFISA